jgi:hypothetical protein
MGIRTDDDGRDLGDLSDIVVSLHDALYARHGKVVLDGDVVGVGHVCAGEAIARIRRQGQRRVGHVVRVLHALLAGELARHVGRGRRLWELRELLCVVVAGR